MKRLISTILVVMTVVGVVGYSAVWPKQQASAEGSAALSIVPKKNYTIEAGKSINDTLVIRNIDTQKPLNLSMRVIDFTYSDETGTPKLMLADDAPRTTWSLKPFMTVPKNVTIKPNSTQTIDMSIDIPANQGAGSYYSAIVYSSGSSESGNVGLNASGVTLVFTGVPGDVKEDLQLEKIGSYNSGTKKYNYFNFNEPQRIGYTLNNKGNVFESPVGTITLKNLFGQEININNINPNSSLALIGQKRTFEACVKTQGEKVDFGGTRTEATTCTSAGLWPGYYSVNINAFYGQNGNNTKEIQGSGSFWYLPIWFVILAAIVLIYVSYHTLRFVRFVRGRKKGSGSFKSSSRRR